MRVETIRIAGFRGFRRPVELRVPSGFLVVTGRNGSGKSTICDAIEYALTGLIERYSNAKETRESIADYLWWRGDEPAESGYVEVDVRNETTNELTTIRRDRTGKFDSACLSGLTSDEAPSDSITQLCLTSIIRDDTIGKLSFELSETKRAGFVEAAVGSGDLQRYETLLQECVSRVAAHFNDAQREFNASSIAVVRLREELAAAQARLSPSADVTRSERRLRELVGSEEASVSELLLAAEREQIRLRQQEQQLIELLRRFDSLTALTASRGEREASAADAKRRLQATTNALEATERELRQLRQERESAAKDESTALARLHSSGSELGLDDGRCPLCHSSVRPDEFSKRLDELQEAIEQHSGSLSALESRYSAVSEDAERLGHELAEAKRLMARSEREDTRLTNESSETKEAAVQAGFEPAELGREEIEQRVTGVRTQIAELHMAAAILEAQTSLERISELQNAVASAQRLSDQMFAASQATAAAKNRVTEALHGVQTLAGTITQERLGSISPLLSDLYLRVRPHPDWRQLQHRMRGDVRMFLRLLVGTELNPINPRFVFSSGQRRAAGLAFLLAVHLSRSWCRLDSLVLDDPVQHIDDFRALQLIEVLSAIRQSDGRQVICTVEDSELATVMARRLRASHSQPGTILRLQSTAGGESLLIYEDVHPTSGSVIARSRSQAG